MSEQNPKIITHTTPDGRSVAEISYKEVLQTKKLSNLVTPEPAPLTVFQTANSPEQRLEELASELDPVEEILSGEIQAADKVAGIISKNGSEIDERKAKLIQDRQRWISNLEIIKAQIEKINLNIISSPNIIESDKQSSAREISDLERQVRIIERKLGIDDHYLQVLPDSAATAILQFRNKVNSIPLYQKVGLGAAALFVGLAPVVPFGNEQFGQKVNITIPDALISQTTLSNNAKAHHRDYRQGSVALKEEMKKVVGTLSESTQTQLVLNVEFKDQLSKLKQIEKMLSQLMTENNVTLESPNISSSSVFQHYRVSINDNRSNKTERAIDYRNGNSVMTLRIVNEAGKNTSLKLSKQIIIALQKLEVETTPAESPNNGRYIGFVIKPFDLP